MKKTLMLLTVAGLLISCTKENTPTKQIPVYEVTGDFELREETDREITLRDTTYYFWSVRDCSDGSVKCLISIKREKNFRELYDR